MHRILQNFLDDLQTAGSAKQLCQTLGRVATGMDLPTFAYIAIPATTGRQPRLITNYAGSWRKHYVEQRYETCDPVVLHSIRQPRPFTWGRDFGSGNQFTRKFFDEAASYGICYGYTIPIHHWHGRFAALTFATGEQRTEFKHSVRSNAIALQVLAYQFHRQARSALEPVYLTANIYLTCRERQCLSLAAQYKTFDDIGFILGISVHTVKDHIRKAKQKLGVRSVRQAAERFKLLSN